MIVNSFAVLDAFVAVLRLGLVPLVLWLAATEWLRWRRAGGGEARHAVEERLHLLFLLGSLLLVLNFLAWPLFYLLLQSYIPEWPGIMCIYGVTRIGADSLGPSRRLPLLIDAMQLLKPILVFLSGAWFVLHLVNRQTRTAPLTGKVLIGLAAAGLAAGLDAAAELGYLLIPKTEEFPAAGCCAIAFDSFQEPQWFLASRWLGSAADSYLFAAYYGANLLAVIVLGIALRWRRTPGLAPLLGIAGITLLVNTAFLVESAAPRLLKIPGHHCPYDLVGSAPASIAAAGLFVFGTFCLGWSCCLRCFVRSAEAYECVLIVDRGLLALAALAYTFSVLILSVEMVLA